MLTTSGFDEARQLMQKQDLWCARAQESPLSVRDQAYPSDLELESVVGVLRGDVQINNVRPILQGHLETILINF